MDDVKNAEPNDRTDDVEKKMHRRCAPRVAVRTDRGKDRRNAGADIHAHQNGDRRAIGHLSRRRERLQNTDGRTRRLDDRSQTCADEDAENGVGEHKQQILELRHIAQSRNGIAHHLHTEHQRCKAEQDRARILALAVFCRHIEDDAQKGKHRRK